MKLATTTALLALVTASGLQAGAPHLVFAHYMVCFESYGESLDGYKREIQQAQAAGIDGFALNVGAWDDSQAYYKSRVALIYNAAEQLGTGFKLFFSVDFENASNTVSMVESFANRTNSFHYQGKLVLSSYGHNDVPAAGWTGVDWTNAVIGKLVKDGIPVFFIPHFFPSPVQELPGYADAQSILKKYGNLLDGLFLFVAAGLPGQLATCNSNYTAAVHAANKVSMASVSPHYWGCVQSTLGRRYFESDGAEGLAQQWNSIIATQPDWVELVTWNDWNESTYLCPIDDPGVYFTGVASPRRYTHSGYLEFCKHFISWFKNGNEPALNHDTLFCFYRTHPRSAAASDTNDLPVTWFIGDVQDNVYATVLLTSAADLEIQSGKLSSTNSFGPGLHSARVPFGPGPQSLNLRRNGTNVVSIEGVNILSNIVAYDFFPYSACNTNQPQPPGNFRILGAP
ncbi:MAG TPA: endo-1,3-alpha-glucanase family glycosylhydrolase [Verrucomicrobiae bacterium]|nr:endo-1,3-alpha-glucanase family glycosylhydrolase [Verrucomicrobiae bacterium]